MFTVNFVESMYQKVIANRRWSNLNTAHNL